MNQMLFEQVKIVPAFQSQTGAAIAGDWVKMSLHKKVLILIHEMRGANATATVFRVDKAKTAAGGSESTGITMSNFWAVQDLASVTGDVGASASVGASDTWTKQTAATSFTGSTTQSVGQWYAIEVDASELAPDDEYDWIQIQIVSSNAAHYLSAWYILYSGKFAGAVGAANPTVIA